MSRIVSFLVVLTSGFMIAALSACTEKTATIALRQAAKNIAVSVAQASSLPLAAPEREGGTGDIISTNMPMVTRRDAVGHRDFNHAKQILETSVFTGDLQQEFYCGCKYDGKAVDLSSCGVTARRNIKRANRIEWEHIVPAWEIGHQRQCWQNGGRKNCTESDPIYRIAEGDLNNLVPAVGEINGDRSNFPYSQWTPTPSPIYGSCQTIVDFGLKRAQPRLEIRGPIARVFFYMHERYNLRFSNQDRQLMCAWAKAYAVDAWEQERNRRIIRLQGEGNPYVERTAAIGEACKEPPRQ